MSDSEKLETSEKRNAISTGGLRVKEKKEEQWRVKKKRKLGIVGLNVDVIREEGEELNCSSELREGGERERECVWNVDESNVEC